MLARLAKSLPTMAKGLIEGSIGGKGTSVLRYPRWNCPACMKVWGKPWRRRLPDNRPCASCAKHLRAGGVIMVSLAGDRFVKVSPKQAPINPEYAGKILRVPIEAMNQLLALSEVRAAESPPAPPQSPEIPTPPSDTPPPGPAAPGASPAPA